MSTSSLTIGWIGAGRMVSQLVTRLLDAGYDVSVYNRTAAKAQHLAEDGATVVGRPVDWPTGTSSSAWSPPRRTSSRSCSAKVVC